MAVLMLSMISYSLSSQVTVRNPGFQPEVGQEGKDVVWVPTPQALVDKMLDLAKLRFMNSTNRISYLEKDYRNLSSIDSVSFDLVISSLSIHQES